MMLFSDHCIDEVYHQREATTISLASSWDYFNNNNAETISQGEAETIYISDVVHIFFSNVGLVFDAILPKQRITAKPGSVLCVMSPVGQIN